MLEFINNNGILFSGIFSVIVALISAVVSLVKDNKASKLETIRSLKKELEETKKELTAVQNELAEARSLENAEKNIDKTHGHIYHEKFPDGTSRTICGFCWEKDHIKIPIVVDLCYEEYNRQSYYDGYCNSCKAHCIENVSLPF